MPKSFLELLKGNQTWVKNTNEKNPAFFETLSHGQKPDYLWIGCSDSRVPATEITNTLPGSIFVHRNIANMANHTDINMLSVVYYAVKVLKVKHIIVCGHYGCGGVLAAMGNQQFGFLDNWLMHIKDVYSINREELDNYSDETTKGNRFVELNVMAQVKNLAKISFIQEEWGGGNEFPYIHGWVYNLADGVLKDLKVSQNSPNTLHSVFQYDMGSE